MRRSITSFDLDSTVPLIEKRRVIELEKIYSNWIGIILDGIIGVGWSRRPFIFHNIIGTSNRTFADICFLDDYLLELGTWDPNWVLPGICIQKEKPITPIRFSVASHSNPSGEDYQKKKRECLNKWHKFLKHYRVSHSADKERCYIMVDKDEFPRLLANLSMGLWFGSDGNRNESVT